MGNDMIGHDDVQDLRLYLAGIQPVPHETPIQLAQRGFQKQQQFLSNRAGCELPLYWNTASEDQHRSWVEWATHKLAADAEYQSWFPVKPLARLWVRKEDLSRAVQHGEGLLLVMVSNEPPFADGWTRILSVQRTWPS